MVLKKITRYFLLIAFISLISSCVTQKKKDDVSKMSKFYHNTTAKYNGYFNANVLLTESIAKLENQHQDNYNKLLPLFPYVAADNPKAVAGDLDLAIEKVAVVATIHDVSHWRDDCYVLLGKAQYLKKNYEDAEETFEFFKEEFDPETIGLKSKKGKKRKRSRKQVQKERSQKQKASKKAKKKRQKERKKYNKKIRKQKKKKKKKKGKKRSNSKSQKDSSSKSKSDAPVDKKKDDKKKKEEEQKKTPEDPNKGGLFKHKAAYDEGLLWLARTYIERENFFEAELTLNQLSRKPNLLESIRKEIPVVQAYYYLKQKRYQDALAPLEKAVEMTDERKNKARYAYIIAQIYQGNGQNDAASQAYQRALKFSTSYDMEFSAKLNLTKSAWENGQVTADATTKKLIRMTKDIKNEEYQDQIYFVLAEIALKQNDTNSAIVYLKESLKTSTANAVQKAESYNLLADLYFESQQYVEAKSYYDSTLMVLPKTDERYSQLDKVRNNLVDIAKNLTIITEQDSLLQLADMSPAEKQALAYKLHKENEDAKRKSLLENAQSNTTTTNSRRPGRSTTQASTFFAYDDKKVKKGKKEFDRNWGKRTLEDNWRRSNRRDAAILAGQEESENIGKELTQEEIDKILKDIPTSPGQIQKANKKIEDALFALGRLYREKLDNNEKSVEALEDLLKRFPESRHQLDAWYYLYLAHTDLRNNGEAKRYYDLIVNKHPESTFAKVLTDPNFLQNNKEAEQKIAAYYDETYEQFKKGDYKNTVDRISKVKTIFGPTSFMQPKFALLNAMCTGNIKGKQAYVEALKNVVANYPKSDEKKRANEILRVLGEGGIANNNIGSNDTKSEDGKSASKFKVEPNAVHYYIVVLKNKSIKLSEAKNKVSDFNKEFYKLDRLRISNIYLGSKTDTPILVIRRFKTMDKAMGYYDGIQKNSSSFLPANAEFEMFPVSQNNYRQILKAKSLKGYSEFFSEAYLN